MTDHPIRFFTDDAAIVHLGEGQLACTLMREEWTHEAHLAACLYLLTRRLDIDVEAEIAGIISRFNESVGGVNDDHNGYHDTITRAYLAGVRWFLGSAENPPRHGEDLVTLTNALLASEVGSRDWPLRFYSASHLFSVQARRGFVEPDLAPLP